MRGWILASVIGLVSSSALAAETPQPTWFEVARIGDAKYARTVFVAREGAVVDGFAKYWSRLVYALPHTTSVYDNELIAPENAKGTAQYIEIRTLHLMDCNKRTFATSRMDFYDLSGKIVSRGLVNQGPTAIEPKSLQAQQADIVCQ